MAALLRPRARALAQALALHRWRARRASGGMAVDPGTGPRVERGFDPALIEPVEPAASR